MAFYRSKKKQEDPIKQEFTMGVQNLRLGEYPGVWAMNNVGTLKFYYDPKQYSKLNFTDYGINLANSATIICQIQYGWVENDIDNMEATYTINDLEQAFNDGDTEYVIATDYKRDYTHWISIISMARAKTSSGASYSGKALKFELIP